MLPELRHAQPYRAALQALLHATRLRNDDSFSGRAGKITCYQFVLLLYCSTLVSNFNCLNLNATFQVSASG